MKLQIDWKKAIIFAFVAAGLLYLTRSFLMSLGIILLLFVVDYLLADWERRRKAKEEQDDDGK